MTQKLHKLFFSALVCVVLVSAAFAQKWDTPGIDAVMIGPADLSISLGVPGDFQHPKVVEAMEAIRDSCNRRGIAPGTQTRTLPLAKFWRERGMRFLGCSSDVAMLFDRAKELMTGLKEQ